MPVTSGSSSLISNCLMFRRYRIVRVLMYVFFSLTAFSGLLTHATELVSEVDAMEYAILKSRRSLRSGHVELKSKLTIFKGKQTPQIRAKLVDVYFSDDKIRADFDERYFPLGDQIGTQSATCRVACSFVSDEFRLYSNQQSPVPRDAEIRSRQDAISDYYSFFAADPRKIGMSPSDTQTYKYVDLEYFCANPKWTVVEDLGTEVVRGKKCRTIKYRKDGALPSEGSPDQNILTVWFSIEQNNNILALQRDATSYVERIECDLMIVEGFGWFPSFVEFTRWDDGKVNRKEELAIVVHQLNEPVDSSLFELKGMGVPNGLGVVNHIDKNSYVMTENGLEERIVKRDTTALVAVKSGSWRRTLLFLNGIVVGVVALLLFRRHYLKLRSQ